MQRASVLWHLWSVSPAVQHFSTLRHKRPVIPGQVFIYKMCVLNPYTAFSAKFLILRRIQRDIFTNAQRFAYQVSIILVRVQWNYELSWFIFKNTKISNFSKVRPVAVQWQSSGSPVAVHLSHADTQTCIKFIVTFRNFKKAPKILLLCEDYSCLDEFDATNYHTGSFFLSSLFNPDSGQTTCDFFEICSISWAQILYSTMYELK
jgi:hypothetical protein